MLAGFLATCVSACCSVVGVVGLFDFWSEHQRRRTLRRFCSEIDESSIPAAVGDTFARLWCVNGAFLRSLGHAHAKDLHGRWLFEFLENTDRCAEIYRSLQTGRAWEGRLRARRQDAAPSLEFLAKVTPYRKTGLARWTFFAPAGEASDRRLHPQ